MQEHRVQRWVQTNAEGQPPRLGPAVVPGQKQPRAGVKRPAFKALPGVKCAVTERALDVQSKTSDSESWSFHSLTHDLGQVTELPWALVFSSVKRE